MLSIYAINLPLYAINLPFVQRNNTKNDNLLV